MAGKKITWPYNQLQITAYRPRQGGFLVKIGPGPWSTCTPAPPASAVTFNPGNLVGRIRLGQATPIRQVILDVVLSTRSGQR